MNFKYRILGIDPGLALIGYSLLGLNNKIDKKELICYCIGGIHHILQKP